MKAMIYTEYGSPDVLRAKEIEKPTPKDNQVLIKVQATSINAAEYMIVQGKPFLTRLMVGGILKPKRTNPELTSPGRLRRSVETPRFRPGDEV